jgi:hypothetical protein
MENTNQMDPNHVPEEFRTPYDVIELPSQGILYKNNVKTVKVEYLTAMDESILSSPNISSGNKIIDILLKRKVKDLSFDISDLTIGDRTAIMLFLRTTAFGEEYTQLVWDDKKSELVEGVINLSELKQKKLIIKPDENGEFEFLLPKSNKNVTFTIITGKDEEIIEMRDEEFKKRSGDGESNKIMFTLEQQVKSIDGERDKLKISNLLKRMTIIDSRTLRKYIDNMTPGMDFETTARTHGGGSVTTFLRFNTSFFWPEL